MSKSAAAWLADGWTLDPPLASLMEREPGDARKIILLGSHFWWRCGQWIMVLLALAGGVRGMGTMHLLRGPLTPVIRRLCRGHSPRPGTRGVQAIIDAFVAGQLCTWVVFPRPLTPDQWILRSGVFHVARATGATVRVIAMDHRAKVVRLSPVAIDATELRLYADWAQACGPGRVGERIVGAWNAMQREHQVLSRWNPDAGQLDLHVSSTPIACLRVVRTELAFAAHGVLRLGACLLIPVAVLVMMMYSRTRRRRKAPVWPSVVC